MPLVRVKVRNEYGLGKAELYKRVDTEDPKAVLEGVAVSGLVGILRQLGDLAEFAAEIFHGLQEQVTTTASRSQKLAVRVQNIEASLPSLEKVVLAQTSHIHFAYTAGIEWHPRIRTEKNHFIYHDLPRFIMDSYEQCRDPPRLHLLDKFDTDGPGSCLKRYSDPTFFKRVSETTDKANCQRFPREKKAHKSKRKRSLRRNREVMKGVSISNLNIRTQDHSFENEQPSPSRTASTQDMPKPEPGPHLNSSDLRSESGYIECDLHSPSSIQPEEHEYQESPSFSSKHNNDTHHSVFLEETTSPTYEKFSHDPIPEQAATCSSSGVMWDEKAEISAPINPQTDLDKDYIWDLPSDNERRGAVDFGNDLQMDEGSNFKILPESTSGQYYWKRDRPSDDESISELSTSSMVGPNVNDFEGYLASNAENILEMTSNRDLIDESESEPDNYEDALNTIESESENDHDYQTKIEVKRSFPSDANYVAEEDRVYEDHHCSTKLDSPNGGVILDLSYSVSVETLDQEQLAENDGCDLASLVRTNSQQERPKLESSCDDSLSPDLEINHKQEISKSESVSENSLSPDLKITDKQDQSEENVTRSFHDQSFADISGIRSKIEFNPGMTIYDKQGDSSGIKMTRSFQDRSFSDISGMKSESESNPGLRIYDKQDGSLDDKRTRRLHENSSTDISSIPSVTIWTNGGLLGLQPSKPHDFAMSDAKDVPSDQTAAVNNKANKVNSDMLTKNGEKERDSRPLTYPDDPENDDENTSGVFELRQRLLVNGLCNKLTLVQDNKFEPDCSGNVLQESSIDMFPSSPPLKHMSISFQPITTNGLETFSKLKLKLPDNSPNHHESKRGLYPSFQLVPEDSIPVHDMGSTSDDDTFCRSSETEDDCISRQSESNSGQWESGEISPKCEDNRELYDDALHGVSLLDSMSNHVEINGAMDLVLQEPKFNVSGPVNVLDLQGPQREEAPLPPPLPPDQWRVSRSLLDVTEIRTKDVSETLKLTVDSKSLGSTVIHKLEGPKEEDQNNDIIALKPKSKKHQKLNGQREARDGNAEDEREEFLQQIRAKSFNLRRNTMIEKPICLPGPAPNVNVSAILEKANAIRQAVASDDGDDSSWSDT